MLVVAVLALLFATSSAAQQAPGVGSGGLDGRSLYLAACATCHGGDGAGVDRALVAFEEELPDFTDCSFASREPVADWVTIAHQGGPVRGFSEMMPSFGAALSEEELERVVTYVSSLCTDDAWPRGELNLPRPLVTEKAFPEDEWVLENEADAESPASFLHTLVYEKRFGPRTQVELAIPYGYRRQEAALGADGRWSSGFGDVALGLKHAVLHGLEDGRILSVVGEVKLPTGDESDGFGSGATAFEAFLSFAQLFPSDAFLQMTAGAERSTSDEAETELFTTAVVGKSIAQGTWGRVWSPMLEVVAKREDEEIEWELLPQLHVTLNTRQHVMVTLGPRIPLGDEGRPLSFVVNFLWDWFDGGLLDGW
jgi:mono/diheme cytochrome c family protein